ncbi:MAG: S9 family peptidase [Candidatus Eisenbacteria bacterium]|nr:S9 family peptidase [Candidatus Eisenbacteria bacterium]
MRRRSPCRPVFLLIAYAAALLAPSLAIARADRTPDPLLPLAKLLAPPTNQAPQVSPDGRWVSFMRPVNGAVNLFVAPAESLSAARALTRRTGRGLQVFDVSGNVFYRWTPDSRRILFPVDHDGDEKWSLHSVDVASGEEKTLTDLPGVTVDLQRFDESDPGFAAIAVRERPNAPDLYRLDLATGERTLILRNPGLVALIADGRMKPRLGISYERDGSLDLHRPTAEGGWEKCWDLSPDDTPALLTTSYQKAFSFGRGGESFYLYSTEGRDNTALVALDVSSGARAAIAQAERGDIGGVLYHPVSGEPLAYATTWARTTWTALDPSVRADFEKLARVADGDLKVLSLSRDLGRWIVEYTLSDAPTAYYLYDRASARAHRLFSGTPELEGLKLSRLHPFEMKSSDGLPLVSYYLLPPWSDPDGDGKPNQPQPAVVIVHGGPSDERASWAFAPFVHWLANRGYAVLYLNYRGSPGFGKAFMNAQNLEWGGRMSRDLLEQVEWTAARGIVARDRVAIMGGSYGGYATLAGMTLTPGQYACGISLVGPSNIETFMPHWNVDRMSKIVGDPRTEEGRAHLRSRSPVNFAAQARGPLLIGQGANDSRVPQAQSDTIVTVMRAAGAPVVYAVYPDEGHGLLRAPNSRSFWAIAEQFLARAIGGRAEPFGDALEGSSVSIRAGADWVPGLAEALAKRGANKP